MTWSYHKWTCLIGESLCKINRYCASCSRITCDNCTREEWPFIQDACSCLFKVEYLVPLVNSFPCTMDSSINTKSSLGRERNNWNKTFLFLKYNCLSVSSHLSLDVTTYFFPSNYPTKILYLSLLSLHFPRTQFNSFLDLFIFRLIITAFQVHRVYPFISLYSLFMVYFRTLHSLRVCDRE